MLNVFENGDVELTRGDTARISVNIFDNDGNPYEIQNGDKLDLTLKKTVKDAEAVMSKQIEGINTFHIEPKDTADLEFKKYVYDVQLTTSEGDVYTVIPPSTFEIKAEVTSR